MSEASQSNRSNPDHEIPSLSTRLGEVGRSVYSQLIHRLKNREGEIYPLHVGDTYLSPPIELHDPMLIDGEYASALNRYTPVRGADHVVETARRWLENRQQMVVREDELIVTGGATGGLSALLAALLSPGDELLLLAPFWPLMAGATRLHGALPVAVPFFQEDLSLDEAISRIDSYWTDRVKAIYVNTPNNPTGEVLSSEWIEAIVSWASYRKVWVISDEVYDLFCYHGEHTYARPLAPDRVISAFSMSKAFGMAGYRCGLLQGPSEVITATERVLTHSMYSAATPGQFAASSALSDRGLAWAQKASTLYQEVGNEAARRLQVPEPQGSTFLFINVSDAIKKGAPFHTSEGGVSALLEACVDHGLLIAPGSAFGPYPEHVRVCFTAAPPEVVLRGVEILANLLSV